MLAQDLEKRIVILSRWDREVDLGIKAGEPVVSEAVTLGKMIVLHYNMVRRTYAKDTKGVYH